MHYSDMRDPTTDQILMNPNNKMKGVQMDPEKYGLEVALVTTIRQNYKGFTKWEIKQAREAREALAKMGGMSKRQELQDMVCMNQIPNCPFTPRDIANAKAIFNPDLPTIRGKTVHRRPELVQEQHVDIPHDLWGRYWNVTVMADIMFVQVVPFFVTMECQVCFTMIEMLPTWTAAQLNGSMERVLNIYAHGSFNVTTIYMDGEFDKLKDLCKMPVNTTAANKHVPQIECQIICTIKE